MDAIVRSWEKIQSLENGSESHPLYSRLAARYVKAAFFSRQSISACGDERFKVFVEEHVPKGGEIDLGYLNVEETREKIPKASKSEADARALGAPLFKKAMYVVLFHSLSETDDDAADRDPTKEFFKVLLFAIQVADCSRWTRLVMIFPLRFSMDPTEKNHSPFGRRSLIR
jgi:hypothetical protein